MSQIRTSLTKLFSRHRIVIWTDAKQEQRAEFENLALESVEKLEIQNNEFGLKYRILRQEAGQKFLLYRHGSEPAFRDNWLLDVELAYGRFSADLLTMRLTELGLSPIEYEALITDHGDFFSDEERCARLQKLRPKEASVDGVRLKMVAVCAGVEDQLDYILEALLNELAEGSETGTNETKFSTIQQFGLEPFLWARVSRQYGYPAQSTATATPTVTPTVRDFALTLFQNAFQSALDLGESNQKGRQMGAKDYVNVNVKENEGTVDKSSLPLHPDAIVFLKRWKDNRHTQSAFRILSADFAEILQIQQALEACTYRDVIDLDIFEQIDRKILPELVQDVANRVITAGATTQIIRERRQSHWHQNYHHEYETIAHGARFLEQLASVDLTITSLNITSLNITSLTEGIEQYSQQWYKLDQLYRGVIYHYSQSGQVSLLGPLRDEVENRYSNSYLLPLNDRWQQSVDAATHWRAPGIQAQQDFYRDQVLPFLQRDKKVFVIISDAMRYEIGQELAQRMRQEDRFEASVAPALTMLPSYTQLGMAALLPHSRIEIDDKGAITLDGQSPQGTENRKKILSQQVKAPTNALQAEEFLEMKRDESRALFSQHDVVYIYHNRIDAVGDQRDSEERTCEAVNQALDELVKLIKKAVGANVTNFLVTADHGFIYQHNRIDESEYAAQKPSGQQILSTNRRYVLGQGLKATSSFKHFTAAAVGIQSDLEMLIPKSINRLRVRGAGSRYVHGGASLQEVVIPIVQINKSRHSDITQVEVNIISSGNNIISTGQLSIAFYQTEPVTDKIQPRLLRAGLYTQEGQLISDQHQLTFDLASTESREREVRVQFVLTKAAEAANGQEVLLTLEEPVAGTSRHTEYKSARYTLRRSFTSDFDF
ncbi:MAG: BREX-1 system phosphatase PglZ type A [Chloroflexota bacterium]